MNLVKEPGSALESHRPNGFYCRVSPAEARWVARGRGQWSHQVWGLPANQNAVPFKETVSSEPGHQLANSEMRHVTSCQCPAWLLPALGLGLQGSDPELLGG